MYQALRVTHVYAGSPASYRVESGDVITRVDGKRTETYADFAAAVGFSTTGTIDIRVRDVRTGHFVDIHGIKLAPYPAPGPAPGPAPPPGP